MHRAPTRVERIGLKIATAYGMACLPAILFLATMGPHGPIASIPEAIFQGLVFPWEDIARLIQGKQKGVLLSLIFFWPFFLIGIALVWWTERLRATSEGAPRSEA